MEIPGISTLSQDNLLVNNLLVSPPAINDFSTYNNFISGTLTTEPDDVVDISDEAYQLAILDGIEIPQSPTAAYNNDFNNLIVNYLNRDLDF